MNAGKPTHYTGFSYSVRDPEFGQLSADLPNNRVRLTQLWVIFRVNLTDFRVIVDPEWSLAPMDHFRVKFDPRIFRVHATLYDKCDGFLQRVCLSFLISSSLNESKYKCNEHIRCIQFSLHHGRFLIYHCKRDRKMLMPAGCGKPTSHNKHFKLVCRPLWWSISNSVGNFREYSRWNLE